ncbi:hypothetical protein MJO29_015155 [Puccinia striiformis f. sp. tritici]|uniref:uncharacterized protein n=1 Tax=Puccinia striiformis f. sp. tritici TaxID=168172 RepID=UPI0020083923|nr:uncharacterized protein Pst134EA_032299 [Puccinia striiformis f. sp. tritici]XP_047799104.1 hypothetical protein Pst134EA_028204 [Puccinia striiformis f. sp. tritici]KAH9441809.1 hypothetical protein Pst134EA_032299 [Puccinia striiformis f. sp. tritici]KAH9448914.1 hypothetical protein Pst134EA_028204 [Puccinia striiformis f. sp. tritici]KAI7937840.1 hypothetical protein MJO29_015155 [Puccinia striiformis f. sp. tritici]
MSTFQLDHQTANLVCKWSKPDCFKTFSSAEEMFNHLCDCHVGRKRSGNLSLSCSWEGCDHKAAKRDHMTSHMMVHCPLQTNVCGICDKTFKRSYDLRKHEVTHTAAHHELHTRSRAVVYQELELPFPIGLNTSTASNHTYHGDQPQANRARVYSIPQNQTTAWTGGNVQATVPGPVPRERSYSVPRHNPYQRPQPEQIYPYPSTWNAEFNFPSERQQRVEPIAEVGSYNPNVTLFNQFQFLEQYSQPADSLAPHISSSSEPPSTSSGSSSSSNHHTAAHLAPPGDWSEIFSFVADTRRESEPYSITSDDFSGSDGLSGVSVGDSHHELSRTSSLPCQALYPATIPPFNSYENLGFRHSMSAGVPEEPLHLTDIQIRNFLQQPFDQPYSEPSGEFQSTDNFYQPQNYGCADNLDALLSLADLGGHSHVPEDTNNGIFMNIAPFQYLV